MDILGKYEAKKAEIANNRAEAKKLQKMAVAAIKGGMGSAEWKELMQLFADTPEQLARLLGTDGTGSNPRLDFARTWIIVSAFTCFSDNSESVLAYISLLDERDVSDSIQINVGAKINSVGKVGDIMGIEAPDKWD